MSFSRLRDLEALDTSAFRVAHIMNDAIFVDTGDGAAETLSWMEANDFDESPVYGLWPPQAVSRESLRKAPPNTSVEALARPVPPARVVPLSLGLREAIERIAVHGVLFVRDEGAVVGIATRHDLDRPAVSLFALGLAIGFEQGLRRLLGTYTNRQLTDWAKPVALAPGDPADAELFAQEPMTLADVCRAAWRETDGRLPRALGYESHTAFKRATTPILRLRNHLAHGRTLLHDVDANDAPDLLQKIWGTVRNIWDHAQDREQIWDAFRDSRIVAPGTSADQELARVDPGHPPVHVITACNPFEEVLSPDANQRRTLALERLLHHRSLQVERVDGVSSDGSWREPSFLVRGLARDQACSIGERFGQRAIFEVDQREFRVVRIDGTVMRLRAFPAGSPDPRDP